MRIGVDVKCLRSRGGIARYLDRLLGALARAGAGNEYLLFSPRKVPLPALPPEFEAVVEPNGSLWGKVPGILWQQLRLPRLLEERGVDVLWGPEQTIPLRRGVPTVLTVHDFVHRRVPETMRRSVRLIVGAVGDRSIGKADVVVPNSDFTRDELLRLRPGFPEGKIRVVPCGIDAPEGGLPELPRERRLLFVGSLEPRKNLKTLVAALELLAERGLEIPLTVVGPDGWKNAAENELLRTSPVAGRIRRLGFVDDAELRRLYATSAALVLPSFYEGFGLPVLEALRAKTPVLTSERTAMADIAGRCARLFDPRDPESVAKTIADFFAADEPWRFTEEQEAERVRILARHDWDRSAEALLGAFAEAAAGGAR